jgi:hypothetical protein
MTRRYTRRGFLGATASAASAGVAGCSAPSDPLQRKRGDSGGTEAGSTTATDATETTAETTQERVERLDPVDVRGALYVPARAWNTFQMWHEYDEAVVERDLGYAEQLNLTAIRTWVSFEEWERDAEALEDAIEHFLRTADEKGMEVLFGLFESVGKEPTEENLHDTDPLSAPPVQSPSSRVIQNEFLWDEPREYVRWFMNRWRSDDRLLAVESMNEPGWLPNTKAFARGMTETMAEMRGSVPLTVGSTSLSNNADYVDWGSDVLQFHYNFPNDRGKYHDLLPDANQLGRELEMPVLLSEWQRVADFGWGSRSIVDEWQPDYASLAPVIHEHDMGNFFWSLMVKPAYVRYMRKRGIINGIFHEDGAVWNLDGARAIKSLSGETGVDLEQRREWPEWAEEIERQTHGEENAD